MLSEEQLAEIPVEDGRLEAKLTEAVAQKAAAKVSRGTDLTPAEALALNEEIVKSGLEILEKSQKLPGPQREELRALFNRDMKDTGIPAESIKVIGLTLFGPKFIPAPTLFKKPKS